MNWEAVTALSAAFTGAIVAVTALVGVYQLRQLREQRRDAGAVERVRSLQDTDFTRSAHLVLSLPPGISADDLKAKGREYVEAAQIIGLRFENLGVLVYRGTVSFDVTEDLVGGAVVSFWDRLKDWIRETRETQNYPMWMEWFQWLAEQFSKRERMQQAPAHERHRDWTPTSRQRRPEGSANGNRTF